MTPEEIAHRFTYHPPTDEKIYAHKKVRNMLECAAQDLERLLPEGREKALVMTKIEEAMFWANAAIARQP